MLGMEPEEPRSVAISGNTRDQITAVQNSSNSGLTAKILIIDNNVF